MSFDGIPRPTQLNFHSDAMNPYLAANAAKTDRLGKPLIKAPDKEDEIQSVHKEHRQHHEGDEDEREAFSEEEAEQLMLFAKMRGLMNFSLDTSERYEFQINAQTGLIDLVARSTGQTVMTLTPDELMQLSAKVQRYAGMLTDRSG